jgi:hypothetical protein
MIIEITPVDGNADTIYHEVDKITTGENGYVHIWDGDIDSEVYVPEWQITIVPDSDGQPLERIYPG